MLSEENVRHIAKLARLHLTDEEVARFGGQLTKILDYVAVLGEVDTDGVEEKSQVTGLTNVMQEDVIGEKTAQPSELLECTQLPVENNQIKVMPTIK